MLFVPFFRGLARHLHLACLALTVATATVCAQTRTNSPTAADGFDPNVDGTVLAMVKQDSDGKIIIAGQFSKLAPNGGETAYHNNIARLNADGSVDPAFDQDVNGIIRALVLQPDGKVLIGGDFTMVQGETHNGIARLNQNGSVDSSFKAGVGRSASLPTTPQVFALALQPDGSLVAGGSFGSAQSSSGSSATRNNLARFNGAGVLDATFDPNPNGMVLSLALHTQNRILVGGAFTEFHEFGQTSPTARQRIARLNSTGKVDPTFAPQADNGVTSLAVQADGRILMGGYFDTVQPNGSDTAEIRNHLARLNEDGTLDPDFLAATNSNVFALTVAPDGSLLVGGHFTAVYGAGGLSVARGYAAKLNADGTIDESFNPGVNSDVNAFAVQSDGKIVIGGSFTRAQPSGLTTALVRNHIARLVPNGSLDTAFQLNPGGRILTSVTQAADGKIVVGGSFTNIGGLTRTYLARLNANGSVDPTYNPNLNGRVYALAYQASDNKVIVGGTFTAAGPDGTTRNYIARLNADGTVDPTFDPNLDGIVSSLLIQSDGAIVVGGSFSSVHPAGTADAVARGSILRLTSAGQLDTAYNPNANGAVAGMALESSDGKIIIAGSFSMLQPGGGGAIAYRNYIARLNTDGSVDGSYSPAANNPVSAVAIQPDGKAVFGGQFTAFYASNTPTGVARNYLARVNADGSLDLDFDPHPDNLVLAIGAPSDGSLVVGGRFTSFQPNGDATTITRRYIARLTPAGKVDAAFDLSLNELAGSRVDSIRVTPANDLLVGGSFTSAGGVPRNQFARFKSNGTLDATFDPGTGTSTAAQVNGIALQTDGKVVVVGNFADLGGATSSNVARFTPEGSPDAAFNAALSTDGPVNAVAIRATGAVARTQLGGFAWLNQNGTFRTRFAPTLNTRGRVNASVLQPDGKLIVAGLFSDLGNQTGNIVRFNADGSVDSSFEVTVNNAIQSMVLQPDGKLVIAGAFTTVNGTVRNHIARIDTAAGGQLDSTFDPNADGAVNAVVLQADGALVLGGGFTNLTASPATEAVSRSYIARVDKNGVLDSSYNPSLNGPVYAMALDSSGKVIAGGAFTTAQPNSETTATNRNHLIRLQTAGTVDASFDPNVNEPVYALVVQSNQLILIGGAFTSIQPTIGGTVQAAAARRSIARIGTDGGVDPAFSPATNGAVTSIAVAPDNSILLGGTFSTVTETGGTAAVARNHLARLTSSGMLDTQFNPDVAGTVTSVAASSDGSLLIGGSFTNLQETGVILLGGAFHNIGGLAAPYLAQLNADGSVNGTFQAGLNGPVNTVLPLADGRFVVGGSFTKAGAASVGGIVRFNADGSLDSTFAGPAATGGVYTLALQSDGRILAGTGGLNGLIRLNLDGSQDATFNSSIPFSTAQAIVVQRDGRIVVAGPASGVASRIVRLNADGSADTSFTPVQFAGANDVQALTLQTDGSIIVAGSFTSIGGTGIKRLARLKSNGVVDGDFNPVPDGTVSAVALQDDGRILLGGAFGTVGGLQRVGLARLANTDSAAQTLAVSADGRTITWLRGGASGQAGTAGELAAVTFDLSMDGQTWQPADNATGAGTRISTTSNWQLANAAVPTSGNVYLRARGIVPTSAGKSAGIYETVRLVNVGSPVSFTAMHVVPVVSTVAWDETHYVWTVDAAGVLRISDAFSGYVLDTSKTTLIGGPRQTSASAARLADLSTRGTVNAGAPLISGFVIAGTAPRRVLVRAIGPGLAAFGVTDALANPQLRLFNNTTGAVIGSNQGWNNDAALSAVFARTGAFPLTSGSTDAALVATLDPGTYSVQVVDGGAASSNGGSALVEIYDAGDLADTTARVMNLSSRGTVSANGTLIGGLVVSGNASKTLLVRGVGPALARYAVPGFLADPRISVYDSAGGVVASNDNWTSGTGGTLTDADYTSAIRSATTAAGAFSYDAGSKDAALVITLPAGAYTIQVSGVAGAAGAAMIEVYELP